MKVFIKNHQYHAGHWIYKGYASAWKALGYDVRFYNDLSDLKNEKDFYLMAIDCGLDVKDVHILEKSTKTFLYVQPNNFPQPWGSHPNYVTNCDKSLIKLVNKLSNVKQWTFADVDKQYYTLWNPITIPLAFDSVSYRKSENKKYDYDICYVGGRANNGYDEKYKIMINTFKSFKNSNLKCAFFVEKNISHEEEQELLSSSKLCLNIHDAYQRELSRDTNERTFKSLGLNGMMAADYIQQIKNIMPDIDIILDNNLETMIIKIKQFLNLTEKEQKEIKNKNRNYILNNHCYVNRVEKLVNL